MLRMLRVQYCTVRAFPSNATQFPLKKRHINTSKIFILSLKLSALHTFVVMHLI
jgi:hypothetical protein